VLASWFLSKITVLSEMIRASYPSMVARKMVVVPNPVMSADGRANPAAPKQRYLLLNIGRMDAQKDQSTLIRAFSLLADKYPEWHLRIIGEGELRPQLVQLITQMGLQQRVEMPGVTHEISSEYCAADIFVISSSYEAFGLVTAEAMSYGLPVVGFADCPGTNELILDNECGLLIQAGEDRAMALANGLESLIQDATLRERLGARGIQSIDQRYAISRICDQWESLLQQVVGAAQSAVNGAQK
jgi:glycosyltransferase involved in cell wall biosynthesis